MKRSVTLCENAAGALYIVNKIPSVVYNSKVGLFNTANDISGPGSIKC